MKSNFKTACILIDESDLADFKGRYKNAFPREFCWFPVAFLPMMQLIWQEAQEKYYLPQITDENDCSILTKRIYEKSHKFLRQLCLANGITNGYKDSFPLDFFWLDMWVTAYRIVAFCSDLLNQCPVEEIILIERDRKLIRGGLLIESSSFTSLVKDFFKSRGIKVNCLNHKDYQPKPKTIFYDQKCDLLRLSLHMLRFIRWKALSFNRKNYDYILIKPAYDNKIDYNKAYSSDSSFPQVFHCERMPFLHSWSKLFRFLIASFIFKKNITYNNTYIIEPYPCSFFDFEFDFTKRFHSTIVQFLNDAKWMKGYIDLFWHTCLDNHKRYLLIFSLDPIHLHSYFLIKKTKEANGKVAVWQHGGLYGYADHFQEYLADYKIADYFLSFGESNLNELRKSMGDDCSTYVQVGSNVFNRKVYSGDFKKRKLSNLKGLFIPVVICTFYGQGRVKWDGPLQFKAAKQIIDFFDKNRSVKFVVKGLKGHNPHLVLKRYINRKKEGSVSYIDIPIHKALLNNPDFVILDNPSTPLLQVLTQYDGPIFLMINQNSWAIREDALSILKGRVVYSQYVDELKVQLADFLKTGSLKGVDIKDRAFVDTYIKQFSYREYKNFLQEGIEACQL